MRRPDLNGEQVLTDLGQTMACLFDGPLYSQKFYDFPADVLKNFGIVEDGGELTLAISDRGKVVESGIRLAQACLHVAELAGAPGVALRP